MLLNCPGSGVRSKAAQYRCIMPQCARVCPAISRGFCGQVAELQEQILDLEGRLLQEEIKVPCFFMQAAHADAYRTGTVSGAAMCGLAKGTLHRLDSRILRHEVGFV